MMQNNKSDDFLSTPTSETDAPLRLLSKEEEDRFYAHKLLYNKNLMIEQCSRWLPAEEGLKNMKKQMKRKNLSRL